MINAWLVQKLILSTLCYIMYALHIQLLTHFYLRKPNTLLLSTYLKHLWELLAYNKNNKTSIVYRTEQATRDALLLCFYPQNSYPYGFQLLIDIPTENLTLLLKLTTLFYILTNQKNPLTNTNFVFPIATIRILFLMATK